MSKKFAALLSLQMVVIFLSGLLSKDTWYAIAISLIGLVFNFLVSINRPVGFLFGFAYAITNGALSFYTGVYATFGFMIFLQAPMALYSYFSWGKKQKQGEGRLKRMTWKGILSLCISMLALGGVMYAVLGWLNSTAVLVDDIFFVFSVSACLLLAFRYKNAYIVTLLSGLGGTALWTYQMITVHKGFSLAAFYLLVSINSIIAIHQQYIKNQLKIAS